MASTNFINECKNRANANRLGKIIVDGLTSPITNSDNLQSFEIDSGCYADGNIIGTVYAKCLNANFIASQDNLVDKPVQVQIGVKYADLSTEYINLGKYTVERPNNEITAQYSRITAYSSLYTKLDDKYVCNIDYSKGNVTLKDLYVDVCNQLGLTPVTTTFINSTIPITANPFTNGEKNRTVLQTIAKISCSFIDIDNDTNKIDLCWLSSSKTPDYTFYKNDYSSVEGGQIICGPINCLIIKNSQIDDENVTVKDDESIKQNGEHSITISEDYILHNAELRQQAINSIWNKVKGMKYVDCKLTTYYGKPFLKLGDKIRIYINETEYFDTYVLKHKFTYDGSFTSIIESPALTEQEIKNKQDKNLAKLLSETQIDVNKQLKKITASVSEIDSTLNSITTTNKTVSNKNSLYIEDALKENALEFMVKGKSEQITYTGKNLFNYIDNLKISVNGLTSTLNEDDSITTTGIPTYDYTQPIKVDVTNLLIDGETYTFGMQNADSHLYLQMNIKTTDGTSKYYTLNNGTKYSFVVDKTTYSNYALVLQTPAKSSWGTSSRTITNKYILVKGTDTTFEPYVGGTSSPNPSYPQEINTIKGIENLLPNNLTQGSWYGDVSNRVANYSNIWLEPGTYTFLTNIDTTKFNVWLGTCKAKSPQAEWSNINQIKDWTDIKEVTFTITTGGYFLNMFSKKDGTNITPDELSDLQQHLVNGPIPPDIYVPHGNWLVEKITGKNSFNMLDETNFNFRMKGNSPNYQSFKLIEKASNEIKVSGGGGNYTEAWIDISGLTPNTKYSLSYTIKDNTLGYNPTMKLQSNGITDPNGNITIALGLGNGATAVDTNKYVTFTNIQLEKGSIATEYEPYQEQSALIDMNIYDEDGNITGYRELCAIGDVKDTLIVNPNGTAAIEKRIGKVVLNGSESITMRGTSGKFFEIKINQSFKRPSANFIEGDIKCDYFKTLKYYSDGVNDLFGIKDGIAIPYADTYNTFYFGTEKISDTMTLDNFKSWLSNNNVTVYYVLETPEKISLAKVDIPLFENINNLTLLEDLETDTSIKYLLKTPISEDYITRHEANAKIEITKDSITQLANETETNLNSVNQKYAETKLASDGLSISVADIQKNVNSQQEDISNINSNVNKTNSELNNLKNNINSTNEVVTKMNYSFGTKELTINKETDPVNTGISNKGMIVRNYTTIKTVANDKGLGTDDLIVTNTAQIGYLKFMKSTDENGKLVTDIHHLVSNIQQVSDLVGD